MPVLEYKIRFLTPAFLGGANQEAEWRTPPFKALLRYWWRVVYAEKQGFPDRTEEMREAEGLLFGNAWLENQFCKSLVSLRLSEWRPGRLKQWPGGGSDRIWHPEAGKNGLRIDASLYLGYGPLNREKNRHSVLAIDAGEEATLTLRLPEYGADRLEDIRKAMALAARYGGIGGRCRNGWGALAIEPANDTARMDAPEALVLRDWRQALALHWPHAIGEDDQGPLIWRTEPKSSWKEVIRVLAVIKIGLRTSLRVQASNGRNQIAERHWLAYPVTNHPVSAWEKKRLPNSLWFTVKPAAEKGKIQGLILHMPWSPPPDFTEHRNNLEEVWRKVHKFLDTLGSPAGERRYPGTCRTKKDLNSITLSRVRRTPA